MILLIQDLTQSFASLCTMSLRMPVVIVCEWENENKIVRGTIFEDCGEIAAVCFLAMQDGSSHSTETIKYSLHPRSSSYDLF